MISKKTGNRTAIFTASLLLSATNHSGVCRSQTAIDIAVGANAQKYPKILDYCILNDDVTNFQKKKKHKIIRIIFILGHESRGFGYRR